MHGYPAMLFEAGLRLLFCGSQSGKPCPTSEKKIGSGFDKREKPDQDPTLEKEPDPDPTK